VSGLISGTGGDVAPDVGAFDLRQHCSQKVRRGRDESGEVISLDLEEFRNQCGKADLIHDEEGQGKDGLVVVERGICQGAKIAGVVHIRDIHRLA
jgi:hypothetical protein